MKKILILSTAYCAFLLVPTSLRGMGQGDDPSAWKDTHHFRRTKDGRVKHVPLKQWRREPKPEAEAGNASAPSLLELSTFNTITRLQQAIGQHLNVEATLNGSAQGFCIEGALHIAESCSFTFFLLPLEGLIRGSQTIGNVTLSHSGEQLLQLAGKALPDQQGFSVELRKQKGEFFLQWEQGGSKLIFDQDTVAAPEEELLASSMRSLLTVLAELRAKLLEFSS